MSGRGYWKLIDIIQPGNVVSLGTRWITFGSIIGRVAACRHIYASYLCYLMKGIMKIGHNDKYEKGKCNVER